MKYDEYMDKECVPICDALNELPGVATFESCCGHLKRRYAVYLYTDNPYSMAVIARTFDRRYLPTESAWQVTIETIDAERTPQFCIGIYSEEPFKDYDTMMKDVNEVVESINYWRQSEFYGHFKFNKYNKDIEVIKNDSKTADIVRSMLEECRYMRNTTELAKSGFLDYFVLTLYDRYLDRLHNSFESNTDELDAANLNIILASAITFVKDAMWCVRNEFIFVVMNEYLKILSKTYDSLCDVMEDDAPNEAERQEEDDRLYLKGGF